MPRLLVVVDVPDDQFDTDDHPLEVAANDLLDHRWQPATDPDAVVVATWADAGPGPLTLHLVTEWDDDEGTVVRAVAPTRRLALAGIEAWAPGAANDGTGTWPHPDIPGRAYTIELMGLYAGEAAA